MLKILRKWLTYIKNDVIDFNGFKDIYLDAKYNFKMFGDLIYRFIWKPKTLVNPKTTLECLQQYAEKTLFDSGINLKNVLVHNYGQFGFQGISHTQYNTTDYNGIDYTFKMEYRNSPYIVVPEITGVWEFRAWLHEIGHYVNKHHEVDKPTYIKEYEAEVFCTDIALRCPTMTAEILLKIRESARQYLYDHMVKAIQNKEIVSWNSIPYEIKKFVTDNTIAEKLLRKELRLQNKLIYGN